MPTPARPRSPDVRHLRQGVPDPTLHQAEPRSSIARQPTGRFANERALLDHPAVCILKATCTVSALPTFIEQEVSEALAGAGEYDMCQPKLVIALVAQFLAARRSATLGAGTATQIADNGASTPTFHGCQTRRTMRPTWRRRGCGWRRPRLPVGLRAWGARANVCLCYAPHRIHMAGGVDDLASVGARQKRNVDADDETTDLQDPSDSELRDGSSSAHWMARVRAWGRLSRARGPGGYRTERGGQSRSQPRWPQCVTESSSVIGWSSAQSAAPLIGETSRAVRDAGQPGTVPWQMPVHVKNRAPDVGTRLSGR